MEPPSEKKQPASGTDALGRKVWDKDFYARKAKDALDEEEELALLVEPKKKRDVPPPAARKPLMQRNEILDLDKELGKTRVVTTHTPKQQQGGFWCNLCECLIKDSQAYLDHINGKRHNRMLGMTMRVERVTVDKVRQKLKQLKQVKEDELESRTQQTDDIAEKLRLAEEERLEKKKRKKERKAEASKKRKMAADGGDGDEEAPEEEDEEIRMLRELGLPAGFTSK